MHDRRVATVVTVVFIAMAVLIVGQRRAGGDPAAGSEYRPPVDAPIAEGFNLPDGPYGRGNRGIDYATEPGTVVRAANRGQVIFAGSVAGSLHVTVLHPDGLRTSYSFLASVDVRAGQSVEAGDALGAAATRLHFGVRDADDVYLDPVEILTSQWTTQPHLVAGIEEGRSELEAHERLAFADLVRSASRVVLPGVAGAPNRVRVLAHYATEVQGIGRLRNLIEGYRRWDASRADCTPSTVEPVRPPGRRILVLVAGFGSTSHSAGIDRVDAAALGYSSADVVRFSYRGGRIPSDGLSPGLRSVPTSDYGPADSQQDLVVAADRLSVLLQEIAAAEPGVPIDVVAHSQGGVVSRLAVLRADASATLPASVKTLVTISSPHGGADLATALNGISQVSGANSTLDAVQQTLGLRLDANSPAVAELSEVSPLTDDLRWRGVPDRLNFVSIGVRGDLVVASPRTVVAGEASVVVDGAGLHAHDQGPSSSEVAREIALAVSGAPPTCASIADATLDVAVGESISLAEDQLGASGLVLTAPFP